MAGLEVGTTCIKIRGREAGKKVKIVGKQKDFVIIEGGNVKKRKCNPKHLLPIGMEKKKEVKRVKKK